jgi:fructose-1-phosphate kinase PfkB-like protein
VPSCSQLHRTISQWQGAAIEDCGPDVSGLIELTAIGNHQILSIRRFTSQNLLWTIGADGAIVVTADENIHLAPPPVRGSYPVGSGDAALAGVTVALAGGASIAEAARFGLAAGIANAQLPGAGRLDPAFAKQVLERIRVATI